MYEADRRSDDVDVIVFYFLYRYQPLPQRNVQLKMLSLICIAQAFADTFFIWFCPRQSIADAQTLKQTVGTGYGKLKGHSLTEKYVFAETEHTMKSKFIPFIFALRK